MNWPQFPMSLQILVFLESIDCFCDDNDEHYEFYNSPAVVIQNKHSTFFFEVIKFYWNMEWTRTLLLRIVAF